MKKIAIIYWSGTGNTQMMAEAIESGISAGSTECEMLTVGQTDAASAARYDALVLGCSSMGVEVLEEGEFEPFFSALEPQLSGKPIALFGSYGWGDGQWMRDWQDRVLSAGGKLFRGEGLICNETPDQAMLDECRAFGQEFAAYLQ